MQITALISYLQNHYVQLMPKKLPKTYCTHSKITPVFCLFAQRQGLSIFVPGCSPLSGRIENPLYSTQDIEMKLVFSASIFSFSFHPKFICFCS